MKQLVNIIIVTCLCAIAPSLGGCALFPARTRGEELAVVQAMGVDSEDGALRLSLVTAADSSRGEGPVRMSGQGPTIPAAEEAISSRAAEEAIFCAHTGFFLLGEENARAGVSGALDYVCRSRELRMDVPLLIVRRGTAAEALLDTGDGRVGAAELLAALSSAARTEDGEALPSVGRVAALLAESRCALAAAVVCAPSSERAEGENPLVLARAGWAILKDGALVGFIGEEDAPAVDLLLASRGVHDFVVTDREGRRVSLRAAPGKTEVRLSRGEDGEPQAIELSVRVPASVSAVEGGEALSGAEDADALAAALERELLRRAGNVLRLQRELDADFLELHRRAGLRGDETGELPLRLSVSVRVSHSGDVRDGA